MKIGGSLGEARADQYTANKEQLRFLDAQYRAVLDKLIAAEEDDIDLTKHKDELEGKRGTVAEA